MPAVLRLAHCRPICCPPSTSYPPLYPRPMRASSALPGQLHPHSACCKYLNYTITMVTLIAFSLAMAIIPNVCIIVVIRSIQFNCSIYSTFCALTSPWPCPQRSSQRSPPGPYATPLAPAPVVGLRLRSLACSMSPHNGQEGRLRRRSTCQRSTRVFGWYVRTD